VGAQWGFDESGGGAGKKTDRNRSEIDDRAATSEKWGKGDHVEGVACLEGEEGPGKDGG